MNQSALKLVWQISFGDGYAGSHKFALLTTQFMSEHGYESEIVVSKNSLTEQRAYSRGLRVHSIDTHKDRSEVYAELLALYESHRPSIIIPHHSLERKLSMKLKRKFGRKFINVAFRNVTPRGIPVLSALANNLWFDYQIACSNGVAHSLRRMGVQSNKIKVVHNGIEIPKSVAINNNKLREQLGIESNEKIIGLSTWFHPKRKGFDIFFEAIAGLSGFPFKLLIVGPPEEHRQPILTMAMEYGISSDKIILPGYVENVWEYYSIMDVFVLPSRAEGFSLALLEAMSSGVPVVVSNIPGNDEAVVEGKTGLLFDTHKPQELTVAIQRILQDKSLSTNLSKEGKKLVLENYTIEHIGEKLVGELSAMMPII